MNINDIILVIQGKNRMGVEGIYNSFTGEGIILGYQGPIVANYGEGYDPRPLLDNRREYVVLQNYFKQLCSAAEKLSALTEIRVSDGVNIILPDTPQAQQAKNHFAEIYQLYFS